MGLEQTPNPSLNALACPETNEEGSGGLSGRPEVLKGLAGPQNARGGVQKVDVVRGRRLDPVWEHYVRRYLANTGESPIAQQHYFVQLAKIRKAGVGDEAICRRVDLYFDHPPFALREGARDFARFLRCFDQLAETQPRITDANGYMTVAALQELARNAAETKNGEASP